VAQQAFALRVGAYGHEHQANGKVQERKLPNDDTGFEDGVKYSLYCSNVINMQTERAEATN
jgi:hypothetical protein